MRWPTANSPLRSLLFVPGDKPKMIQKSWTLGSDAIIFDLEDAVAESAKVEARENVRTALETAVGVGACAFVRINSGQTPDWQADVKAVTGKNLHGIVMPKCGSPTDVVSVARLVQERERAIRLTAGSIRLLLQIESARGLLEARRLVKSSRRVVALLLGAEDFCSDMRITRTKEGQELLYARSHLATCARAQDCIAIDTIYPYFDDPEGLVRETQVAKRLGFSGKLAIHPKQVPMIHSAFAPTDDEVREARKVLEAFADAQARGAGVISMAGKMIDKPMVERACQVIALTQPRRKV